MQAWVSARKASDFSKFAPILQEWVDLTRERSKHIDPASSAYDVALQDYEKGMSTARLDQIFSEVGLSCFSGPLRDMAEYEGGQRKCGLGQWGMGRGRGAGARRKNSKVELD